jgi:hypothetical protein
VVKELALLSPLRTGQRSGDTRAHSAQHSGALDEGEGRRWDIRRPLQAEHLPQDVAEGLDAEVLTVLHASSCPCVKWSTPAALASSGQLQWLPIRWLSHANFQAQLPTQFSLLFDSDNVHGMQTVRDKQKSQQQGAYVTTSVGMQQKIRTFTLSHVS